MCSKYDNYYRFNSEHNGERSIYGTTLNEHNTLLFDIEYDIHTSFGNYEESDHGLDLDWLIILY